MSDAIGEVRTGRGEGQTGASGDSIVGNWTGLPPQHVASVPGLHTQLDSLLRIDPPPSTSECPHLVKV